jgi:hypothetical protein
MKSGKTLERIVCEAAGPTLLTCTGGPHIYLLEKGEKRWIDGIVTFSDWDYVWHDVHFVSCGDLRSIPDGVPILIDAGPPPQL